MAPSRTSPDPHSASQGLTKEQFATFSRDGYLIIPNALSQETVSSLLSETHSLLETFSLNDHPMTKFSTGESSEHVGDDYFLSSGDKIRFFFEEGISFQNSIFLSSFPSITPLVPHPLPTRPHPLPYVPNIRN
jgi:phytanoyl-CoA hydroxylase